MIARNDVYTQPLYGKQVAITRAASQSHELANLLHKRGAEPLLYPCLDFAPLDDMNPLDVALREASQGKFDWLVLTSTNAVQAVKARLEALHLSLSVRHVGAVGPATAETVHRELGLQVDGMGEEFRSTSLADAIDLQPGARVLLPKADIAPNALARKLETRGALVQSVIAYRTVMGQGGVNLPALLRERSVDVITLASPSAVRNFLWRLIDEGGSTQDLRSVTIACIGPETRQRAINCGLHVSVTPPITTLTSLVQSLEDIYR
ncbi:MAG: uroporphyrinogen-III synthase [Anaerolineae bacterium]|nr:uroporphyrinogen-III synthase [Anaerolineae bacterium]